MSFGDGEINLPTVNGFNATSFLEQFGVRLGGNFSNAVLNINGSTVNLGNLGGVLSNLLQLNLNLAGTCLGFSGEDACLCFCDQWMRAVSRLV